MTLIFIYYSNNYFIYFSNIYLFFKYLFIFQIIILFVIQKEKGQGKDMKGQKGQKGQ